jgi:hypothetical protein
VTSADLRPLERSLLIAACCAAPVVLFLIVYVVLPNHGLMIDDYAWILQSRVRAIDDLLGLFTHSSGFYRPIVGVSFALNNAIAGSHVASYGIVNVAIALACAAAIRSLGRALGLARGAALFMACVWLLNFQGIRTAVQWVSGRSELLLVLFLALSATALVRHRLVASVVWLSLALFTKEEAIVFPAILLVWMYLLRKDGRWTRTSLVTWTVGTAGVALLYLLARHAAGAITPATAPEYYRFTFAPQTIWRHAYIYADQILTFPLLVTGVATLLLGRAFDAGIRTSNFELRNLRRSPALSAHSGCSAATRSRCSCRYAQISTHVCRQSASAWSPQSGASGRGSTRRLRAGREHSRRSSSHASC